MNYSKMKKIVARVNYLYRSKKRYGLFLLRWKIFQLGGKRQYGSRNVDVIVSLTSYPGRINYVHETLRSLIVQSYTAKKIVLWLARDEFPKGEEALSQNIRDLFKYGVEVRWCENIYSYKKLIPSLLEFETDVIVTADDDVCYDKRWLEQLIIQHERYPNCICAHRITKFVVNNDKYDIIPGGYDTWPFPSGLNKLTGCGGVLYPIGTYRKDYLNEEIFFKYCKTNDDIWFWLIAVINGVLVVPVHNSCNLPITTIPGAHKEGTLSDINDKGEKLFWKDFYNMISLCKELDHILKQEYADNCR